MPPKVTEPFPLQNREYSPPPPHHHHPPSRHCASAEGQAGFGVEGMVASAWAPPGPSHRENVQVHRKPGDQQFTNKQSLTGTCVAMGDVHACMFAAHS